VPRLRIRGAIPPPYIFTVWCLVKYGSRLHGFESLSQGCQASLLQQDREITTVSCKISAVKEIFFRIVGLTLFYCVADTEISVAGQGHIH
jgi:hypothetical protein